MLTINLFKPSISIGFSFLFLLAINTVNYDRITIWSLIFCIVHELSHLAVMHLYKVSVSEIFFYGGGIRISSQGVDLLPLWQRLSVYIAGCAANALMSSIFYYYGNAQLCVMNIAIAFFNLLPIDYFDGGKILAVLLPDSLKVLKVISKVTSCIVVVMTVAAAFLLGESISVSRIMVLSFIILSDLLE